MTDYAVKLDLPDELLGLGIALGVLKPDPADSTKTVLNVSFFDDPAGHLTRVLTDPTQRASVLELAGRLIGDVELELDLADVPEGQTWVPLMTSDDAPRRGLYLVVEEAGDDVLLSLGGRLAASGAGLESAATVLVPLVRVVGGAAPTGAEPLVGGPEGTIRVALTLSLAAGGLGDAASGIELSGASINVAVPTDGSEPVLGVLLRGLRLPGEAQGRDVLMSQGDELAAEAVKILVALIEGQAGNLSDPLRHVFTLLGLHPAPPIPPLAIEDLVHRGAAALHAWIDALAADGAAVKAWLGELAALAGGSAVSGDGSDGDPFQFCVGSAPKVCVTVRLATDPVGGARVVVPGVRLAFEAPATAPVKGRAYADARLCAITLGPAPAFAALPGLSVAAELGDASAPLVDVDAPQSPEKVRIEALRLGLALDADGRLAPLLEADEVDLGTRHYERLDLMSADAVEAAETALEDVLVNLLEGLGAGDEAKALLVLAGVRDPDSPPPNWPGRTSLAVFFANPIAAIAGFHAKVLAVEGAWAALAHELGVLVAPEPSLVAVDGEGTADDPWTVTVFDNTGSDDVVRGSVALVAWTGPDGELHIAGRVAPEALPVGELAGRLSYTIEAAAFRLAAAAPATVTWLPSHTVRAELGDALDLAAGPLVLRARGIAATLGWSAAAGWIARLGVDDPRFELGELEGPLPPLELTYGEPLPPLTLESLPWAVIEALAGQWLVAEGGAPGAAAAALLGWAPLPENRMRLASLPELDLDAGPGEWPRLSLSGLIDDPVQAAAAWLRGLLAADATGSSRAPVAFAVASALAGSATHDDDGTLSAPVTGTGGEADPWALPLGAAAVRPELVAWLEPAGPPLGGLHRWRDHLLPAELTDPLDAGTAPPPPERLFELLRRAGAADPALREALGDRGDLAAQLAALRTRVADGDGLVRAADQQPPTGWAVTELAGPVAHHREPALFDAAQHLPGGPPEARRVFVSAALPGVAPWPGQTPARTIDLREAGLPPQSFDLSAITGPGPWFVLLPSRAQAAVPGPSPIGGLDALTQRIVRVVAAASAAAGGEKVALVAHGASAHPARRAAAAAAAHVSHLVTIGAPHGGATFEFLDQPLAGEAIRLLQRLAAVAGPPSASTPAAPLLDLLATLGAALDPYVPGPAGLLVHTPFPEDDFAVPADGFAEPAGLDARAVVAKVGGETFDAAFAWLVRVVLETVTTPGAAPAAPTHARFGLRVPLARPAAGATGVTVEASARLDLLTAPLAASAGPRPVRAHARAELRRAGGWLAGGPAGAHPAGAPRDPRVRWAEVALEADLEEPLAATVRVTLRDAAVFGTSRTEWVVDRDRLLATQPDTAGPLPPELRVLIGEAARAIGPLPTTGPLRALADLAAALALVAIDADGRMSVPAGPLERLLADPVGELAAGLSSEPGRSRALDALARLVAGTGGETVTLELPGGLMLELVAGPPAAIRLSTGAGGLAILDWIEIDGAVALDSHGRVAADVEVATAGEPGPDGRTAVVIGYDSAAATAQRVRVALERGGSWELPDGARYVVAGERIDVWPLPDQDALVAHGLETVAGQLLRIAIETAVGESRLDGRSVRNPIGLLRDPAGWLLHPTVFGTPGADGRMVPSAAAVPRALDAVRGLLGLPGAAGTLPLPWGFELAATTEGSDLRITLATAQPLDAGGARLSGSLGLVIAQAGGVAPAFSAKVELPDLTPPGGNAIALRAAALEVALAQSLSAALRLTPAPDPPTAPAPPDIVISLVPAQGLAELAALGTDAALRAVLPSALNSLSRATALVSGIAAADTSITVAEPGGFPSAAAGSYEVAIDDERVTVTAGHGSPTWMVQRGAAGTAPAAHAADAVVYLVPDDPGLLPLAVALGELGDALELRDRGRFQGQALSAFAKDPAAELVPRLRANVDDALAAIDALASIVLPNQVVSVNGRSLVVEPVTGLQLTLTIPESDPPLVCVEVTGIEVIDGIEVTAGACVDESGPTSFTAGAEVTGDVLTVAGVPLHPFARVLIGEAAAPEGDRAEAGLWLEESHAVVVKAPFGSGPEIVCRTPNAPDSTDLTDCAVALVRTLLVPLLVDQLLTIAEVEARLDAVVAGGKSIGDVLVGAQLLERGPSGYQLEPDALDPEKLGDRVLAIGVQAVSLLGSVWPAPGPDGPPIRLSLKTRTVATGTLYGVRAELPQPLELLSPDGVTIALEAPDGEWIAPQTSPGLELFLLHVPPGSFDPANVSLQPWLRVLGVGLRAAGGPGKKLIDSVASVDAVAVHGAYDRDFGGTAPTVAGGRVQLERFAIPLGRASGADNPVAAKLLSQGGEGAQSGDPTELAPAFSPELVMLKQTGSPLRFRLRGGSGEHGPWWLPVQRKFGPIYVEQVGFDARETAAGAIESVTLLMDGKASVAGLSAGLDDLSVTIPWATPFDLKTWKLGLAGIGLGYAGGPVTIAGGLKKRSGTPPDYVGMLLARFGEYALTAIGGYAEYPTGEDAKTYTSLFVFAALSAPLGGPPAFFVTGIGAGAGINRRLLLPADVPDVVTFPLVAAMDPQSSLAKDPIGALDTLGTTFPPQRGALWFAAGVHFTSFALVDSIAVLSVAIANGDVEVGLLGLARMALPRPEAPIANLELALRARFSSRERLLAVEAQLTDRSWLISEACKLTGGFAFYIWFDTGQFVLTLGGYHPSFARPQGFPLVPRLGFNWLVTSEIVVKGEAYFALTATCVMAGGRLEASYRSGSVWAGFVVGMDAIVSWDPFFYDFSAYVSVSAGIEIKICLPFVGCARIRLSLSLGANAHVWGPKLRGEATLDLQIVKVTVKFGAHGEVEAGKEPIGWPEFRSKYLVAGDPSGETMEASVLAGQLIPDRAAGQAGAAPTGGPGDPWLVTPEFTLASRTRAASNLVNGHDLYAENYTQQAIGLGPMRKPSVRSEHSIVLKTAAGVDVTGSLTFRQTVASLPEGIWRVLDGKPAAEAKVRPAFVGGTLEARTTVAAETARVPLSAVDTNAAKPLPFEQEKQERGDFVAVAQGALTYIGTQPSDTADVLAEAAQKLGAGIAATAPSPLSVLTFAGDRVAPPQLAPLGEGMVDAVKPPVATQPVEPGSEPTPPGNEIEPPVLRAIVRGTPPPDVRAPRRTTTAAPALARVQAPRLAGERDKWLGPGGGRLEVFDPETRQVGTTVVAGDVAPPTSVAGGVTEARSDLRADPALADSVSTMSAELAAGRPLPMTAGDVHVMDMPRAEFDTGARRPSVAFTGDQPARVIAFDRSGTVLADQTGESVSVPLPRGSSTVAVAALGKPDVAVDAAASGLAGWHAGTQLAQVAADAYVGPRCTLRTTSPDTIRSGQPVSAAMVRAADAVKGRGVVSTRFEGSVATVAIALETGSAIDEVLAGVVLGLEGADRAVDAAGEPLPPLAVVSGARAYTLFAVTPADESPVTVSVASDERWSLAGVFAAPTTPAMLSTRLGDGGLDRLLVGLVTSPLGAGAVRYVAQTGRAS